MADLATMFPGAQAGQLPDVMGGFMEGQQHQVAMRNAQMNQQRALADMMSNQQMAPLNMEKAQLDNEKSRLANQKSVFEMEDTARLREPNYQAALQKLKADTDENEVKSAHAKLEAQLMSPDPMVRKKATEMYKMTGDMLKMYETEATQQKGKMEVVTAQGKNSLEVAKLKEAGDDRRNAATIAAGVEKAKAKAGSGDWRSVLRAAKGDPMKTYTLLQSLSVDPAVSEEDRDTINTMLETINPTANAALKAKAPAFVLGPDGRMVANPAAVNPGLPGITPNPAVSDRPNRQAEQTNKHSLAKVQEMYPGVPPEKLKEAYKKKFGVDLQ